MNQDASSQLDHLSWIQEFRTEKIPSLRHQDFSLACSFSVVNPRLGPASWFRLPEFLSGDLFRSIRPLSFCRGADPLSLLAFNNIAVVRVLVRVSTEIG